MIYQFRKGSRVSGATAQDVGEVLQSIREKHGRLETETVLRIAQNKRSRIHDAFEWNNAKAGDKYRLHQARQLIRSISVVLEDSDEPAYVHINIDEENYYQSTAVACQNVDEWQMVRAAAIRSLQTASNSLDQLDAVAKRLKHKSRGSITKARKKVKSASSQLQAS